MTNQMLPELKDLHFSAFGYDPLFNTDYYNDIMKGETPILLLFDKEISKMVGFSVIDETKCYIMAFGIHHSYRRRGLGCYLLENTIDFIEKSGHIFASLHVNTGNKGGIGLYEKCGFIIHEKLSSYYAVKENGTTDAYIMKKYIESNDKFLSVKCVCNSNMKQIFIGDDEYICDDCLEYVESNVIYQCKKKFKKWLCDFVIDHRNGYELCLKCAEGTAVIRKKKTKVLKVVVLVSKLIIEIDEYLHK
eukprot:399801_1